MLIIEGNGRFISRKVQGTSMLRGVFKMILIIIIYFSIFDDFTTMLKPSKISYQKII